MKSMNDMKIDFPAYILHALQVLHGEIKYSMLKFMTLNIYWPNIFIKKQDL